MTVGEKIRYIRNLRNLTQKDLGVKSGFSSATADVRIRQYESDKMIPKTDKLAEIASALGVDVSALSSNNVSTVEDILHILFELEENNGATIEKTNDEYNLCFKKESTNRELLYALDSWYEIKKKLLSTLSPDENLKENKDYQIWKMRYPLDIKANEQKQTLLVQAKYHKMKQAIKGKKSVDTFKDIMLIFEEMLKVGIDIEFYTEHLGVGQGMGIFCFCNSQLLSLNSPMADSYAIFLYAIDKLQEYGITVRQGSHTFENDTFTEYYVYSSQVSTMILTLRELKEWIQENALEDMENLYRYKDALQWMNVPIKEYV